MEKFQDIYSNPEHSRFEKVVFMSDTPVIGIVGALNKEILAMMSTKELLAILKNSVPAESLNGIGWGKSFVHEIPNEYRLEVVFTAEKTIKVDVYKLAAPKVEKVEQEVYTRKEAPVVDPAVLDDLMQADALIYYVDKEPEEIANVIKVAGYEVKISNDCNACMQALNYKEFGFVGLVINENVFANEVFNYLHLTNMQSRRKQFSFLITNNVESGDPDIAYSYSVSLVVNSNKIEMFEDLFDKTYESWKRVVDPFVEVISTKV